MEYILLERVSQDIDEPNRVYSEIDSQRMEQRRVEFYPNGLCFAYGQEHGHQEVLRSTPFPTDLHALEDSPESHAYPITGSIFQEIWFHAAETPDCFMQMFF